MSFYFVQLDFTCYISIERCPTGFHFDSISRDCRPIAEAVCDRCPEGEGVFSFPVEGSCIDYTLCINGQSLERSCPNGTRFNPPTERCKPREEVQCQADVICAADIPGIEIMAHPNYCDQFVICMDGEVLEIRQCANGLLFDPSVGQCVRADICSYDISISKRRNSLFDRLIPKAPVHTN